MGGSFSIVAIYFLEWEAKLFSSGDVASISVGLISVALCNVVIALYCKANMKYFNSLYLRMEHQMEKWLGR
jgi:hypothetical protein